MYVDSRDAKRLIVATQIIEKHPKYTRLWLKIALYGTSLYYELNNKELESFKIEDIPYFTKAAEANSLYVLLKENPLATQVFLKCNCWIWYEIGTYSVGGKRITIEKEKLEWLIKFGQYKNQNFDKPKTHLKGVEI